MLIAFSACVRAVPDMTLPAMAIQTPASGGFNPPGEGVLWFQAAPPPPIETPAMSSPTPPKNNQVLVTVIDLAVRASSSARGLSATASRMLGYLFPFL